MKQRISAEDLKQLTPSQQEKLRTWWKPKDGDWFYGTYHGHREVGEWILSPYCVDSGYYGASLDPEEEAWPNEDTLPLLSIGQCLQILEETIQKHLYDDLWAHTEHSPIKSGGWEWKWYCGHGDYSQYCSHELIDALWEAVKSIL